MRNHLLSLLPLSPVAINTTTETDEKNSNVYYDNNQRGENKEEEENVSCFKELTLLRCKSRGRRRHGKTKGVVEKNSALLIRANFTTNNIVMTLLSIQIFILFFVASFKINGEYQI